MPWIGTADALSDEAELAQQPSFIQQVARRVRDRALGETGTSIDAPRVDVTGGGGNSPALIRGYDAQCLGKEQAQVVVDFNAETGTTVHLAAGAINNARRAIGGNGRRYGGRLQVLGDGSYVAQKLGGAIFYAGLVDHWWGPGWVSALSVSTNARPIPASSAARRRSSGRRAPLDRAVARRVLRRRARWPRPDRPQHAL